MQRTHTDQSPGLDASGVHGSSAGGAHEPVPVPNLPVARYLPGPYRGWDFPTTLAPLERPLGTENEETPDIIGVSMGPDPSRGSNNYYCHFGDLWARGEVDRCLAVERERFLMSGESMRK